MQGYLITTDCGVPEWVPDRQDWRQVTTDLMELGPRAMLAIDLESNWWDAERMSVEGWL